MTDTKHALVDIRDIFPLGSENKAGRGVATPLTSIVDFLAGQPLFPNKEKRAELIANLADNGFAPDKPLQLHPPISTQRREAAEAERELLFHNIPQMTDPIVEIVGGKKFEINSNLLMTVLTAMFMANGKLKPVKQMVSAGFRRLPCIILANCIRFTRGQELILQVPAVILDLKNEIDLIIASAWSNNRTGTQDPEEFQRFNQVWELKNNGKTMAETANIVGRKIQRDYNFAEFMGVWPELGLKELFLSDPTTAVKILKAARPVDLNRLKNRYNPKGTIPMKEAEDYLTGLRNIAAGGEATGPKPVARDKFVGVARNHAEQVTKFHAALTQNAPEYDLFLATMAEHAADIGPKLVKLYNRIGIDTSMETTAYILSGQRSSNADTAIEHDRVPEESNAA